MNGEENSYKPRDQKEASYTHTHTHLHEKGTYAHKKTIKRIKLHCSCCRNLSWMTYQNSIPTLVQAKQLEKSEKVIPLIDLASCAKKACAFQLVWVEAWPCIILAATGLVGLTVERNIFRGSYLIYSPYYFLNKLTGVSLPLHIVLGLYFICGQ